MTILPAALMLVLAPQHPAPTPHMIELAVELKKNGMLVGYPDGLGYYRPPTRYEFAVAAHASASHLWNLIYDEGIHAELKNPETGACLRDSFWGIRRLGSLVPRELESMQARSSFVALIANSGRRLTNLGVDLGNFPDVPVNHWAAQATKDLKDAGLLRGYPTGKFGG